MSTKLNLSFHRATLTREQTFKIDEVIRPSFLVFVTRKD